MKRMRHTPGRWTSILAGLTALAGCEAPAPPADPTEVLRLVNEGQELLRRDDLGAANVVFDSLLAIAPGESAAHGYVGLVRLREGDFAAAEASLAEALELNADDPELRAWLAAVHAASGDTAAAISELEANRAAFPDHLRTLWLLAELTTDPAARATILVDLVDQAPANLAARTALAEASLEADDTDRTVAELEGLRQQLPELPASVAQAFDQALVALRNDDGAAAATPFRRFVDYFEATGPYQASLDTLRGPEGVLTGVPQLSFSFEFSLAVQEEEAVLATIRFADGSMLADFASHPLAGQEAVLATGDTDGDGDEDVFAGSPARPGGTLHEVEFGAFIDRTTEAGLGTMVAANTIAPADYDNDGWLDVLYAGADGVSLARNQGDGTFTDVTAGSGLAGSGVRTALWADLDHEGDLDLVLGGAATRVWRNDGDGTFSDVTSTWGLESDGLTDLAFGDFDDDGDLDLVGTTGGAVVVFSNERGGNFSRIDAGLGSASAETVAVVDIDADGALDLALGAASGVRIWSNDGTGRFSAAGRAPASAERALHVVDFDNDARLDLVAGGSSGLTLLRGDGLGGLTDFSDRLAVASGVRSLDYVDYNEDGDIDLLATGSDGSFRLLRNDGANASHYVKLQLQGLASGSSKNNRMGIGSRLEITTGERYQTHVVTKPFVHVGLGELRKADVIRIEWTNGVIQDLFYPGTDQDLEDQILKGSCPMLFTWTGEKFEFQKDVMWKSALGMPTGIQGNQGARNYAPAEASREYVRIPGDRLVARDGRYELRITEELWETIYFDEVRLLALDHPADEQVYVDERFVPPHLPVAFRPQVVTRALAPVRAVDQNGHDVMPELADRDHVYVAGLLPERYQGTAEDHWVELDLGAEAASQDRVQLYLTGWVFPADASLNVAMAQADFALGAPILEVPDGSGGWVHAEDVGFPSGKDKTIIVDLSESLNRADPRVRVRTNMQVYWDWAFTSVGNGGDEPVVTTMEPVAADLRYRGFSGTLRKGGRYGPHWFDYEIVTDTPKWRDLIGNYTRYGDVRELLTDADDMYVVMNAGDEVAIEFDAEALPELRDGWTRDFVIYTVGWVKDGDLNTASGATVGPMPFHGMDRYPYGDEQAYPTDETRARYLSEYQTRYVGPTR